jgi:hypothetical protein
MAPPKEQKDMGSIAQSFKQLNDRLYRIYSTNTQTLKQINDIYDSTMQSVQNKITEKLDKQEATVCALQT